ncbi:hypothetical protein JMJ55_21065 [Belnapia sp. T6]|uniref:Uncharacterized protein n=1 Tax=Belnapia mucosa TaxID=2804532 RepID=A0ABS1V834_9PROT|nr:hypothetical protein [Belnapia mucosa]MBL6457833.1 hypothetical protein [Belnapia mucosa]
MKPIEQRLARLERAHGAGWEAYRHVPPEQWPDAALLAFLGLPVDASDADLQRIIDEEPEAEPKP